MRTQSNLRIKTSILILLMTAFFFACKKDGSYNGNNVPGHTSIKLFLTDDPSLVFDNLFLDIQKVEVKVEDSAEVENEQGHEAENDASDSHGNSSGGWMSLGINPGVYDILQFRNGLDTLFASGSFQSNLSFKKLRITLGTNNSVVFNGQTFALPVKNDDRFIVIKTEDFNISVSSTDFNLWMDLDAGRSVRKHGNDFEFKPEIRLFTKEKAGSIEGRVSPAAASAVVMAINGTDTLSAKPEAEGEFKFIGLKAGTYSLLVHPTANNYVDAVISNVVVSEKEDTNVGVITLHQ
jgi:hypothetical protein